jgi:hypothetical protein
MWGYLSGLSLALRHRHDDRLAALSQVEERRAGEVADVLDLEQRVRGRGDLAQPRGHHIGIEMAPLPVLICTTGQPVARMRSASSGVS